jgi:hypothetical protein
MIPESVRTALWGHQKASELVRFGSLADILRCDDHVRFLIRGVRHICLTLMSALLPKSGHRNACWLSELDVVHPTHVVHLPLPLTRSRRPAHEKSKPPVRQPA